MDRYTGSTCESKSIIVSMRRIRTTLCAMWRDVFKFRAQRREIQGLNQVTNKQLLPTVGSWSTNLESLSDMEQPRWRRPKYLAQNFLTTVCQSIQEDNALFCYWCCNFQALQQRRSQLDNMLIVPPQHMELVSGYVHCGWVVGQGQIDGNAYDKPWKWLMQNQGMHS